MNISILTTSRHHPIVGYIEKWIAAKCDQHLIRIIHTKEELTSGDILFLISYSEIVSKSERSRYKKTLVVHASDLPLGRGWSPHIWEIINGATSITLSLLEAEDKVDSGDIWKKVSVYIPKTALFDEINDLVFNAELDLMDFAIENYYVVRPEKQSNVDSTYWPKRSPKDSLINVNQSIAEQFDLIRVCDPGRFPAYFYKDGEKFSIALSKCEDKNVDDDKVILREAKMEDMQQYYDWINDNVVRRYSFNKDLIDWEVHQKWFCERLANKNCFLYVAQYHDQDMGQVRFDYEQNGVVSIHFLIGREFRGRGLAKEMLMAAIKRITRDFKKLKVIEGKVKKDNKLSQKIFSDLGFNVYDSDNKLITYQETI